MADKWLFILTYLQQNPIQEVPGQLFGMSQSNANKWLHLLHAVLNQALAHQDLLPARTANDLAVLLAAERTGVRPPPFLACWYRAPDPPPDRSRGTAGRLQWQEEVPHAQKPPRA